MTGAVTSRALARPALLVVGALTGVIGVAGLAIALLADGAPPIGLVAALLGAHLVIAGTIRLLVGVRGPALPGALRWFVSVLGAGLIAAGMATIANPTGSLAVVVTLIGIGWIADGVSGLFGGLPDAAIAARGPAVAACALSAVAGILVLALAATDSRTVLLVGAAMLIASGALLVIARLRGGGRES